MIRRNIAFQVIYLPALRLTADGSAVTSGASLVVAKDGAESASAGSLNHYSGGVWKYTPTQGETDAAIVALILTATGADPVVVNLVTTAADTSAARFGASDGTGVTLASGERSAIAAACDVALINQADGANLIGALADAIAADWVAGDASPLAIVAAIKADSTISTALGRIDAAIGSRLAAASYTAPLDASGMRSALGLTSANLDTQLAAIGQVITRINTGLVQDGAVWQFTANMLELAPAGGGGAGDADQDTLLAVQETVDELAAALVGAESIALTGPVTGTDISIVIDSDYRQRSGTELPIPVDDSTGALSTRLNALGLDNLSFGAAREGKAAGEITGTVYSVTNAAGVTTIRVEISNAGSGLSPGEYAWQLQASHTQGDEVDNEIVISGNLILERRTVAPL